MKKQKMLNKIISIIFVFFIFIGLFSNTAYADDELLWPSSSDNLVANMSTAYINTNTMTAVFSYYDYLYQHNLTDGMQLMMIAVKSYGGNNTTGAANKTVLELYFNAPDRNGGYGVVNGTYIEFYDSSGMVVNQYYQAYHLIFGNFKPYVLNQSHHVSNYNTLQAYAYRNSVGDIVTGGQVLINNDQNENIYTYPLILDNFRAIAAYIEGGGVVDPGTPVLLDFGGIISAIMSAPMIVFNGLTGQPGNLTNNLILFGIDIRATLISLLVIAIVVFIIKFMRGG